MPGNNRQTRGRSFWLAILLICAWPLLSGWSLFRDEEESAAEETKDECLRLAIRADEAPYQSSGEKKTLYGDWTTPVAVYDYRKACEGERLRGCLMPPEEHSTVEEYQYRKRQCQEPTEDCAVLRQRIAGLQQERLARQAGKDRPCRLVQESRHNVELSKGNYELCNYEIRRLAAVIDAIAVNEIFFAMHCFD